jgi:hypothetical protein
MWQTFQAQQPLTSWSIFDRMMFLAIDARRVACFACIGKKPASAHWGSA